MAARIRVVELEGLWTPQELGAFLGMSEKTLKHWRLTGYGPGWTRLGKHVRYDPAVVREWLSSLDVA